MIWRHFVVFVLKMDLIWEDYANLAVKKELFLGLELGTGFEKLLQRRY